MNKFVKLPNGLVTSVDENGYITVSIDMSLSDFIDNDLEGVLDAISNAASGTELLSDISYVCGATAIWWRFELIGPLGRPGGRGQLVHRLDETCREGHTLFRHRLHCLVGDIFNLQGNQGDDEP